MEATNVMALTDAIPGKDLAFFFKFGRQIMPRAIGWVSNDLFIAYQKVEAALAIERCPEGNEVTRSLRDAMNAIEKANNIMSSYTGRL